MLRARKRSAEEGRRTSFEDNGYLREPGRIVSLGRIVRLGRIVSQGRIVRGSKEV